MKNYKLQIKSKFKNVQSGQPALKFEIGNLKLNKGFTLIEILVVLVGFTLISMGLIGLFGRIFDFSRQQNGLLNDQSQAGQLAPQLEFELRNAQSGSNGAYTLDTAATGTLIFYSVLNVTNPAVDRIRYFVQNGQLWKGVTVYNGNTYNTSTEYTSIVQKDLANGATPVFYYYDGSYTGSSTQSSLTQPVNVTTVKFVQLNLQIYNKAGVKNSNTYTVTGGAAIRNLKTNLGS
jgi:Tfp pilus assembly protein PilV